MFTNFKRCTGKNKQLTHITDNGEDLEVEEVSLANQVTVEYSACY